MLKNIGTPESGVIEFTGYFKNNAGSSPATWLCAGVTSITRTGTGTYSIVFNDAYPVFLGAHADQQLNAVDDKEAQVVSFTSATKTLVIKTIDVSGAAAADIAANTNNVVNFKASFKLYKG